MGIVHVGLHVYCVNVSAPVCRLVYSIILQNTPLNHSHWVFPSLSVVQVIKLSFTDFISLAAVNKSLRDFRNLTKIFANNMRFRLTLRYIQIQLHRLLWLIIIIVFVIAD